jgi:NADH dehydrogenase [ubiquinone] 1 alpha subcomplex assembly factor 7
VSLLERLRADIRANGPLSVADYMQRCLHDSRHGYYATRPSIGADGDFITSPMVSQMFGELLGLWCLEVWVRLGRPPSIILAEVGPGDGTLMSDVLRAARAIPEFLPAAEIWLIDPSGPLQKLQRSKLADCGVDLNWASDLSELPEDRPVILLANEILDCLPGRQFVRVGDAWVERLIGLDDRGKLVFGLAPHEGNQVPDADAPILEISSAQEAFGESLGARVARSGGAALLIDYGRAEPEFGDTLQALLRHTRIDPLAAPGQSDLTMHADFPLVANAARSVGALASPILPQGAFLGRLGIQTRADTLTALRPDRAQVIERQLKRLVAPDEMGELFKVLCLHQEGLEPPGFEADA